MLDTAGKEWLTKRADGFQDQSESFLETVAVITADNIVRTKDIAAWTAIAAALTSLAAGTANPDVAAVLTQNAALYTSKATKAQAEKDHSSAAKIEYTDRAEAALIAADLLRAAAA